MDNRELFDPNKLAKVLLAHRKKRGFSLREAGARAGVNHVAIRSLETAQQVNPRLTTLCGLAKAYGTTVTAILNKAGIN